MQQNGDFQSSGDRLCKNTRIGDLTRGIERLDILLDETVVVGRPWLGRQIVENALLAEGIRPHELNIDLLDQRRLTLILSGKAIST